MIYGLLRLANSALYANHLEIHSPVQAVSMLGTDRVFRWASLLVLSGCDNSPLGYLGFALQRARACEIVAEEYGRKPQLAYMAGLLSTLDSILNAPLPEIIRPLPLDALFKKAILQREGELGAVLDAVLGYEAGNFEIAARHGFAISRVQSAFWDGVAYSAAMIADLKVLTANSAR